jgi:hypothetical protein
MRAGLHHSEPSRLNRVCAGCAITAMAGATGARSWLQAYHATWLTPNRMRAATVALFLLATGVSSVGLSGSTARPAHKAATAVTVKHPR